MCLRESEFSASFFGQHYVYDEDLDPLFGMKMILLGSGWACDLWSYSNEPSGLLGLCTGQYGFVEGELLELMHLTFLL